MGPGEGLRAWLLLLWVTAVRLEAWDPNCSPATLLQGRGGVLAEGVLLPSTHICNKDPLVSNGLGFLLCKMPAQQFPLTQSEEQGNSGEGFSAVFLFLIRGPENLKRNLIQSV